MTKNTTPPLVLFQVIGPRGHHSTNLIREPFQVAAPYRSKEELKQNRRDINSYRFMKRKNNAQK